MRHKYLNLKKENKELFNELVFNKHIFKEETQLSEKLFYFSFGEFGCESIIPTFLIPRINNNFKEYRKIVVGWQGREYFYRDVCDEFWEIDNEFMSLKNRSHAFENHSTEIASLEKRLSNLGIVINGNKMGNLCLTCRCAACSHEFPRDRGDVYCPKCNSVKIIKSLIQGCKDYKNNVYPLPQINQKYIDFADELIPEKSVALFARNRKTYGRNLPKDFYNDVINLLTDFGYKVVLLGEVSSSYNIDNDKIINLMNHEYVGNLEAAFAVVKKCDFSLQFYTASTRISSLLNKPFVLVESPEQMFGRGQEGFRLSLMTKKYSDKKLVVSNFVDVVDNFSEFLTMLKDAVIDFIVNKNSEDVFFRPNDMLLAQSQKYKENIW